MALLDLNLNAEVHNRFLMARRRWHVNASTGNNANDGSADFPLQTLAAVRPLVQSGDMIILEAGTFSESNVRFVGLDGLTILGRGSFVGTSGNAVKNDTVTRVSSTTVEFTTSAPHGLSQDNHIILGNVTQTGDVRLNGAAIVSATPSATRYQVTFSSTTSAARVGSAGNEPYVTGTTAVSGFFVRSSITLEKCSNVLVAGVKVSAFNIVADSYASIVLSGGRLNTQMGTNIRFLGCQFLQACIATVGAPNVSPILQGQGRGFRIEGCNFEITDPFSGSLSNIRHLSSLYLTRASQWLVQGNTFAYNRFDDPFGTTMSTGSAIRITQPVANGPELGAALTNNLFAASIPSTRRVINDEGANLVRVFFRQNNYPGETPLTENLDLDPANPGTLIEPLTQGFTDQDALPTDSATVKVAVWGETTSAAAGRPDSIGEFLALLAYSDGVVIDLNNGVAGTDFGIGTSANPVNNFADAVTIINTFSLLKRVRIHTEGSPITLQASDGDVTEMQFEGIDPRADIIFVDDSGGAVDLTRSRFRRVTIRGDITGEIVAEECTIGGVNPNAGSLEVFTGLNGLFRDCGFRGASPGRIELASGANVNLQRTPASADVGIPGLAVGTILDFGVDASAKQLLAREATGFFILRNIAQAGSVCAFTMESAQVTIESTCTAAQAIILSGEGRVLNNSPLGTGFPTGPIFLFQFTPEEAGVPLVPTEAAQLQEIQDHLVASGIIDIGNGTTDTWIERRFVKAASPPDVTEVETYELYDQDGGAITGNAGTGNNPLNDPTRMIAERRRI